MSLAVLLAQHNTVVAVDRDEQKVEKVNRRECPFRDREIEEFLATRTLDLTATTDAYSAYSRADIVVVATPMNYDPERHSFDCSSVETVLAKVDLVNPQALVVIKSTIPF